MKPLLLGAMGAGGVAVVILASLAVARLSDPPRPKRATPATFGVAFQTSPPGAAITVNGQPCGNSTCEVQLPPGAYEAEATLPGYRDATASFTVSAEKGGPGKVTLHLQPAP